MNNKKHSMSDLEREIALVENDAIAEEQNNADRNYYALDCELNDFISRIPYPDTEFNTTGIDREERERIKYEKKRNEQSWNRIEECGSYCKNGSLYTGHLNMNNSNYYIMDGHMLRTRILEIDNKDIWLVNADDVKYKHFVDCWRYPTDKGKGEDIRFSRNITMNSRIVSDVDVTFDESSEIFSNIFDKYLLKALIRNKEKSGMQSIIQTIQKKQDDIRSLPKDKSFIVQGCAGSGKTMVLLHRLRYLLYNKEIYNNEYIFLVPSKKFKEFIGEISLDFNINPKNIMAYQEYYQELIGKKSKQQIDDANELVFTPEYLERVYSRGFIQEAYKTIFEEFLRQMNLLGEICESKLEDLIEFEKIELENLAGNIKEKAVREFEELINDIKPYIEFQIDGKYENLQFVVKELEEAYRTRKHEYDMALNPETEITVSPDDERILNNETLRTLNENIEAEREAISKASIFTLFAHKSKLEKLEGKYSILYEEFVQAIIAEDKLKYKENADKLLFLYSNYTLDDIESILINLKSILSSANEHLLKTNNDLENVLDYISTKYKREMSNLSEVIKLTVDLIDQGYKYVERLAPSYLFFEENVRVGVELLNFFKRFIKTEKEIESVRLELPFFAERTENQLYAYLNTILFNVCKKKISDEFKIKVCDIYKHYWYLTLYCNYLTRPYKAASKKYIFVDEAQDLSVSEIELIYKINNIDDAPVVNLFGDTNQVITTHGIVEWSALDFIHHCYELDENFRNTNQIVEYCNNHLPIHMSQIGVDMDSVSEYETLYKYIELSGALEKNFVFIVKDEYSEEDLKCLLADSVIKEYEIYTVKSVKGLEFKEVFVFDQNMTINEKYISYTRALVKLNVIKNLPEKANRNDIYIVQGEAQEEDM